VGSVSTLLATSASSSSLARLQQLQEKRAVFHHPTFANHFAFGRAGTGLRVKTTGGTSNFASFGSFPSFTAAPHAESPSTTSVTAKVTQKEVMEVCCRRRRRSAGSKRSVNGTARSMSASKVAVAKAKSASLEYTNTGDDEKSDSAFR
jgi:hypothetical protein